MAINYGRFYDTLHNETYRPLEFMDYSGVFRYVKVNHKKRRIIIERENGKSYWGGSTAYFSTDSEDEDFDKSNTILLYDAFESSPGTEKKSIRVEEIINAITCNNLSINKNNISRDYEIYVKGRDVEESGHYICDPYIEEVCHLVLFEDSIYALPYYTEEDDYRDDKFNCISSICKYGTLLTVYKKTENSEDNSKAIDCACFINILNKKKYRSFSFQDESCIFRYVKVNHRKKRIILEVDNRKHLWKKDTMYYSTDSEDEDFDVHNMILLYENESGDLTVKNILDAINTNDIPYDYEIYIKRRMFDFSCSPSCFSDISPVCHLVEYNKKICGLSHYNNDTDNYMGMTSDEYALAVICSSGTMLTNTHL